MKKVRNGIALLIVVMLMVSLAGAAMAHPHGGPPGQVAKVQINELAENAELWIGDALLEQDVFRRGMTIQFVMVVREPMVEWMLENPSIVAILYDEEVLIEWSGNGIRHLEALEEGFREAELHWVYSLGGARFRGNQVLTLSSAEPVEIIEVE